jgi:hypothetical protein|nr:MAG TPA: hypothetical protein [Caudoviricetes sp.]
MRIRLAKKITTRLISQLINDAFFDGKLNITFPYSRGKRETADKIWTKEVQKRIIKNQIKHISLSQQTARELNRRLKKLQTTNYKA